MTAEQVNLVSLGDSIATGTLTPFARTYSYVFYLQKKFREAENHPAIHNLAHDGDTSRDLLWKLNRSRQFRNTVQAADLVTVSIGGNDLLRACSIPGFASINPQTAERGAANFVRNWPQIVEAIKALNPGAGIVVLNLYNPYNHARRDKKLHELTDRLLIPFNEAIEACPGGGYRVADTYTAFKQYAEGKMHRVSCLYPESPLRNPHPTPVGQKIIADLVFDQLGWEQAGHTR